MYCDRVISEELQQNKILWGKFIFCHSDFEIVFEQHPIYMYIIGEGLSGSIRESDLITLAPEIGFTRPLLVTKQPIQINNEELLQLIGSISILCCLLFMVNLSL